MLTTYHLVLGTGYHGIVLHCIETAGGCVSLHCIEYHDVVYHCIPLHCIDTEGLGGYHLRGT